MKESLSTTAKVIKRITLDDVYQEIETKTGEIKKRQEEDFRYLNRRIDDLGGRIDALSQKIDTQIGEVRQEIGQTNRRFDTVIQMILDLSKQVAEIAKQKN
jgi:DNA repair exonuclease SbcCD ATPase subunit